jgi:nucleoside-diphosphate-sugar epimerase
MSDSSSNNSNDMGSGSDSEDQMQDVNLIDIGIPVNANTKILVTGGNGYLGSHIVYYLLEKGVSVKVSVHDMENQIGYSHLEELPKAEGRLEIVEAELTDKDVWKKVCEGCDAIIHTASPNPFKAPK